VRVSDLLGLPVLTESGEELGTVHDLRAELGPRTLRVTGLVLGGVGLLERLGIGAPRRLRGGALVLWSDIVRVDRRGILVSDDVDARRS
jgi:sporulation protein YlmC with PRC-barrel domain